jgi:hypothetical protein
MKLVDKFNKIVYWYIPSQEDNVIKTLATYCEENSKILVVLTPVVNDYSYTLKECMSILKDDIWIYEMELGLSKVMKKRAKIYCDLNKDAVLYKDIKNEI